MIDTINTRRSVRKFKPDPVPESVITRILEATMNAPSAMNEQAWQFIVLSGDMMKRFTDINRNTPKGAPVGVLVCGDLERSRDGYYIQDCSAATQNILLAAHALGLGSVWTTVFPDAAEPVRQLLGLPAHIAPFSFTPIGHAEKKPAYASRFNRSQAHYNGWQGRGPGIEP